MVRKIIKTKRDLLVFLSHPFSGKENFNMEYSQSKARFIWEAGYTVINPLSNTIGVAKSLRLIYQDYLDGDFTILKNCDVLFDCDSERTSVGCQAELALARELNIRIVTNLEELDRAFEDILKLQLLALEQNI